MERRIKAERKWKELYVRFQNESLNIELTPFSTFSEERKLQLIDHYLNWEQILNKDKDLFNKYVSDGIHPGPEEYQKVITPTILKTLGISAEPEASFYLVP